MKHKIISLIFIFALIISSPSLNAFAVEMTDGTYEVSIALWHSEDDKESMAAESVGKKATIVVENGVKTMHVTSDEMSMMGIKASLQELKIADANGNYTDAKVESRDSEGNPTSFYFTLPHAEEYITVKVNPHIAIMGNKDIGARIKVDYSTLKLIKSAETVSETTAAQTVADNGESVTEIQTFSQSPEIATAVSEETIAETYQTTESDETELQTEEKSHVEIYIVIAILIAVLILIIIKKKLRKHQKPE